MHKHWLFLSPCMCLLWLSFLWLHPSKCLQEGFKSTEHLCLSLFLCVTVSRRQRWSDSRPSTSSLIAVGYTIATLLLVTLIIKVTLLCGDYRLQHSIELSVYSLENIIGTKDQADGRAHSQAWTLLQLHGFIHTQDSQGMKLFVHWEKERKILLSGFDMRD